MFPYDKRGIEILALAEGLMENREARNVP
jgi:hypothetical protein